VTARLRARAYPRSPPCPPPDEARVVARLIDSPKPPHPFRR
jgi:hypothetical protein